MSQVTEVNLSEHKLEIVKEGEFLVKLIFRKGNGSSQLMKFMVTEGKTFITGDWGDWIICREINLEKDIDRQYLKQKITALPNQTLKSGQTFWFNVLMDGLELMHELYKKGDYETQHV